MASPKMIAEAEALVKEAEKHLKTGILKWNPEFDLAASSYTKAATSYKNAKEPRKSLDCWIKAADCHIKNKVPFQAAKAYEQGAFAARDSGDAKKAAELLNQAYMLFIEVGSHDTAGTLIDRGGRMLEEQFPLDASQLYRKAADLAQISDKYGQASEMFDRAARLLVKMEKFDEAAKVLEELLDNESKQASPAARRYAFYLVLVQLKRDDYVAGMKACQAGFTFPDPSNANQLGLAQRLLDSYDKSDREALKSVTSHAFIRSLDPVYARLARSLDVPEGDFGSNEPELSLPTNPLPPAPVPAPAPLAVYSASPPLTKTQPTVGEQQTSTSFDDELDEDTSPTTTFVRNVTEISNQTATPVFESDNKDLIGNRTEMHEDEDDLT